MIASFAVSYVIQNGILMVYGARPKAANLWADLDHVADAGDVRVPLLQLITIVVTMVLMAALTLVPQAHALRHDDARGGRGLPHGAAISACAAIS